MKSLKRTIASLTAVLTTAAMAMSAAPAFAYEDITAAKAEFVNSFNDGIDREVAQYMINNGYTLEEAKNAMKMYMDGLAIMETSSNARTTSGNYYYSTTHLANSNHFALLIAVTPAYTANKVDLTLNALESMITSTDSSYIVPNYASYVGTTETYYYTENNKWCHEITLKNITAKNDTTACAAVRIPITPTSLITSENALLQNLSLDITTISNYTFALETYASGDVNHDGKINLSDYTLLSQYIVEAETLDIVYADGSNHYSFVTNAMAADFNCDGVVNFLDLTNLDKYIKLIT